MTEQKPRYDQSIDYGGPMASHSEYKPGEQAPFIDENGQQQAGEVLHVSNGPGGQLYIIENPETGFPDVVPASEIAQQRGTKQ